MNDIFIYLIDMPVNEVICPCGPFSYNVYINSRLSYNGQLEAFKHALKHIQNNDFEKFDVQEIERVCHADC